MKTKARLTIAIQKSGRLNQSSMELLGRCGLKMNPKPNALLCHVENLPIDILLIRDDDIPAFVIDKVCDLGVVGENVLFEKVRTDQTYQIIKKLGFGKCRLSIALPEHKDFAGPGSLNHSKIATSYPYLLSRYLSDHQVQAQIIEINGSVEITPRLKMADAICDLVSSGRTLEENKLQEVAVLLQSQAVLIQSQTSLDPDKQATLEVLGVFGVGVSKAQESKYIMFHAPINAIETIKRILPGCETPTILPLQGYSDKVAVHVVSGEGVFWNTLENLKQAGASSILVLPIEKMMN